AFIAGHVHLRALVGKARVGDVELLPQPRFAMPAHLLHLAVAQLDGVGRDLLRRVLVVRGERRLSRHAPRWPQRDTGRRKENGTGSDPRAPAGAGPAVGYLSVGRQKGRWK